MLARGHSRPQLPARACSEGCRRKARERRNGQKDGVRRRAQEVPLQDCEGTRVPALFDVGPLGSWRDRDAFEDRPCLSDALIARKLQRWAHGPVASIMSWTR